jgi:lactose/cellobiose-specific phosphotransferase system IIC component
MELGVLFVPGDPASRGGAALPSLWLGVHGLLWATVIALAAGFTFRWFLRFKRLRMVFYSPSSDVAISQALDTLIPGLLTIIIFAAVKTAANALGVIDIHSAIYQLIYLPFNNLGDNLLETAAVYNMARHLLWFIGLHGSNVLEPIMTELYLPGVAVNQTLLAIGQAPVQVFTKPFFDCYTSIGGSGSTMGLLIACLLRHRDSGARKIARISMAPAIFNINEILLFGLPVVLNPIFLIPFIVVPLAQTAVAYAVCRVGLAPLTVNDVAWNVPVFINGYLSTGSAGGVILQLACLILATLIYLPFVKLDNALKAEQFDRTFKKLVQVVSTGEAPEQQGPRFLSSPDTVGSLARGLAQDIERALARKEFHLEYQPQVNSDTGLVYGVEALMRWRHPQIGAVPPPVFIGLAEDTGFIKKLGLWALDEGCRQAAEWRKVPAAENVVVSVNVSSKQLEDQLLVDKVADFLVKYQLPVKNLKVEVTESIAIGGNDGHKALHRFSKLGVKLAIDDFGMGHTSLNYLREFKVDSLKLDSVLSRDVLVSRSSREIISSIAELCRSLDIELIAECVEDEDNLMKLRELGCRNIQGYFYSPALKPDRCLEFILQKHRAFGPL